MSPWRTPVRSPDLAELETLVACATEGTISASATRLGISRPAVAKRITNLEALAGRQLLHRGARGVRLTDDGARLLAGARRMLEERDALIGVLTELRGGQQSPIAGLRELLGHSPAGARAAQLPESRLLDTERVLELVLGATATGVVLTDPETAAVHAVNDAFCLFSGCSREALLGGRASAGAEWYLSSDRPNLLEEVRRATVVDGIVVRMARADGALRVGEASAHLVSLAGGALLLGSIEDVTERPRPQRG